MHARYLKGIKCVNLHCWFRLSPALLSGKHTGQSCLVQFFQWEMICLEEAQWATAEEHKLFSNAVSFSLCVGRWNMNETLEICYGDTDRLLIEASQHRFRHTAYSIFCTACNIFFTHPGRICQPDSASCGWGRSSWFCSGAGCTGAPLRWPVPCDGTCERAVTAPAAVGWAYVSRGPLQEALSPQLARIHCPPHLSSAKMKESARCQNNDRL